MMKMNEKRFGMLCDAINLHANCESDVVRLDSMFIPPPPPSPSFDRGLLQFTREIHLKAYNLKTREEGDEMKIMARPSFSEMLFIHLSCDML